MLESEFQSQLIKELEHAFDGCVIMKNDANYRQGFPDLLLLVGDKWACLEVKAGAYASRQPNQDYWVDYLSRMGFGAYVYPENKDQVIEELYEYFSSDAKPALLEEFKGATIVSVSRVK